MAQATGSGAPQFRQAVLAAALVRLETKLFADTVGKATLQAYPQAVSSSTSVQSALFLQPEELYFSSSCPRKRSYAS